MAKKVLKSIRRFGARYGRTVKHRFGHIEEERRKKHVCPYCHAQKIKRLAIGIWFCGKCKSKFTGKAYTIRKKIIRQQVKKEEEEIILPEETQEEPVKETKKKEEVIAE